ncbi:MAG TPA: hypothetical protein VNF69_11015 [Burkholderiales bacterium]|nr:hypothetical protein [Burkholderiales bacterium]
MRNHWTAIIVVLLLSLLCSTALADGGIGLRWSIALPGLSARANAGAPGLHVGQASVTADELAAPAYSIATPSAWVRALPSPSYDLPPGLTFYYRLSQVDDRGRDPGLYRLASPSGLGLRTMGLTVVYPF